MGTMKNGEKAPYVILMNDTTAAVINLHPEHAKRLFKKGEDSGVMLTEAVFGVEQQEAEPAAEEMAPVDATADQPEGQQEQPAAEPKVSKKSQAIAIFNANADKARKEVIEMMVTEIGLTKLGAATYYQNIKSGQWK